MNMPTFVGTPEKMTLDMGAYENWGPLKSTPQIVRLPYKRGPQYKVPPNSGTAHNMTACASLCVLGPDLSESRCHSSFGTGVFSVSSPRIPNLKDQLNPKKDLWFAYPNRRYCSIGYMTPMLGFLWSFKEVHAQLFQHAT